ncbi:hypothetical protein [Bacillus thuringiensis]|uniref:DM10 domain-containing protein n=1 Tax=Bacillus thuringiensis TaxID=1428 RepID=A0A9X7BIF2_BACTU|nr:hypothetical protein [Bacillus thuringiensis]MED4441506.1 hypothetical protein [Bacillus cereus]MED3447801.1 hypothetical protein [Bacillus thuringiensis]PEB47749.1 hypothetical protein COM82_11360 [Bacillus thuringiensis]PED23547.1 hypothetical protein CON34_25745 [Bacillus thuringiensis]PFB51374.1 hypothetical protein CN396_00345 [Bacillus thuringiensis]
MPEQNPTEESSVWPDICSGLLKIISIIVEHNDKITLTHNIINEIGAATDKIETYLEKNQIDDFKGKFKASVIKLEEAIRNNNELDENDTNGRINNEKAFKDILDSLINLEEDIEVKGHSNINPYFILYEYYPLLQAVNTLMISVRGELKSRFNDYLQDEFILIHCLEPMLELQHRVEKMFYEQEGHYNYFAPLYKPYQDFMVNYYAYRKELERLRYIFFHNLNCNFQYKVTNSITFKGGLDFHRCKNSAINLIEGRRVLAVNNTEGELQNPSIYKEYHGLPKSCEIHFEIIARSKKIGRVIQLEIWELNSITKKTINTPQNQKITLQSDTWETYEIKYTKQEEDTFIECEVYWYDNDNVDLLFQKFFFNYNPSGPVLADVPHSEELPTIHHVDWHQQCSSKDNIFEISDDIITTQYLAAHDGNRTFNEPYIYTELGFWWDEDVWNFDVEIEAYVRTRHPIDRKAQIEILELDGDKREHARASSNVESISNEWIRMSLFYKRSMGKSVLRFQVKWFDNEPNDIMVRDIVVKYYNK